ncbi:MAG TPA: hypothetical protein VHZ96_11360 [Frankiaceae bacterium]|jgi:hypothetical protein|nr:hypothetical protein [Frankiaceae bacterium]
MSEQYESEQSEPEVRRDRREHAGAGGHPDDDALARRTEQERVDAGLDAFDPDDVPPAADEAVPYDPAEDEANQEAAAEVRRQESEGELYPLTEEHPYPPTRYDRS